MLFWEAQAKLESPHQGSHTVKSSCRAAKLKTPYTGQAGLKILILGSKTEKSFIRAAKLNILILRARLISPKAAELINPEEAIPINPKAAVLINPKAARLDNPRAARLDNPKVAKHCGHHANALQGDLDHLHIVQAVVEAEGEEEVHEQVPDVGLHAACQVHHLVRIQSQGCADLTTFLVHTCLGRLLCCLCLNCNS